MGRPVLVAHRLQAGLLGAEVEAVIPEDQSLEVLEVLEAEVLELLEQPQQQAAQTPEAAAGEAGI